MPSPAAALKSIFGFDAFRPGQEEIVDALLAGRDALAIMPTGAGKSLCYQLPALIGGGLTIVVSPLIALMDNQIAHLRALGAAVGVIHSGRSREESVADWRAAAAGRIKLLYMSPERLMSPRMIAALAQLPVSRFVVDEAHCISQWGHDFRPDYMALSTLRQAFPRASIAAFTATADEGTRRDIVERLLRPGADVFVHDLDRPNIEISIERKARVQTRVLDLLKDHDGEQGIVYCLSRRQTEDLAAFLNENGRRAAAYHAGLDAETRTRLLNDFLAEPDLIIVATVAFGMGIDKPDIRFVIHTDMPASIEAYYQEIGRAGRDGLAARAVLLYGPGDVMRRIRMLDGDASEAARMGQKRRIEELGALCEMTGCRRQALLAHFGQRVEPCGNCDNCRTPAGLIDATAEARLLLEAARATGEMFGAAHLIDILRGADTQKIRERGHDNLAVYGKGAKWKQNDWRAVVRQMNAAGYLRVNPEFGGISLGPRAPGLLRDETTFEMRPEPRTARRQGATAASAAGKDGALFAALKAKRREIASERNVAAYVVFSDRTLADMAAKKPRTTAAFGEVFGVGRAKTEAFGALFIAVIEQHVAEPGAAA
ncbi:MAG: DNA helicase RecQ [Pseudomonadota bacterium]